jgi:hypothetical protein
MAKLRKTILALFLGAFAVWVAIAVWIDGSYFSRLPKTPNPTAGRTYRMVVSHGSIRYGSEREFQNLRLVGELRLPAIMLFLIAVLWGLKSGDFHIRGASTPNNNTRVSSHTVFKP